MNKRYFLCLTLLLGLLPALIAAERKPRIVFIIGESEYNTRATLPEFAKKDLEPKGIDCTFAIAPSDTSNDFPGLEGLKDADLLFISVRRRTPSRENMALIRKHVAAGKPVVGICTASHAFALRGKNVTVPEGYADWPEFDHEVLGGNYNDHYGKGIKTFVKAVPGASKHPV